MAAALSQNIPKTTDGSELAVKITEYHAGKVAFILDGVELGWVEMHEERRAYPVTTRTS